MAESTIKTNQRTLRHTASGGQTFRAQIAELKPVFDSLPDAEKRKAVLVDSTNQVFNLVSMLGVFTYVTAYLGGVLVYTFNLSTGKRLNAGNNAISDVTDTTNGASVSLYA